MSPAFREEIVSLLGDTYSMMAEAIARRQGISEADARALIDGGPYGPLAAKAAGLISRIGYADQIEAEVAGSRSGSPRSKRPEVWQEVEEAVG